MDETSSKEEEKEEREEREAIEAIGEEGIKLSKSKHLFFVKGGIQPSQN